MTDIGENTTCAPADGRPSLTARQRAILNYIRRTSRLRGYAPSYREIGDAVGLSSPSSVAHQVEELERKGHLRRTRGRARALSASVGDPEPASGPRDQDGTTVTGLPPSPLEVVGPDDYAYALIVDHQGNPSVYGTVDARTAAQWLTALAIGEWRKVDGPGNSVEKLAQFLRDHG